MATTVAFMTQHQIILMVFVVVVCVCFCCCCCCCVCCCLCYINWVLIPISCTVVLFPAKILKELLKTAWQNRSQTNFSTTDVKLTALKCKDVSVFGRRMRRPYLYSEQEGEISVHQGNISLYIICALTEVQSQCIKLAQTNHCNKCWIGTSVAWKQAYGAHQPVKASP